MSDATSDIQWFLLAGFLFLSYGVYSIMKTLERIESDIDELKDLIDTDRDV